MKRISRLLLLAATLLLSVACAKKNPVLTVDGGQVQGVETRTKGVIVYKGIPYAAPPVGEFRWREPRPVLPWKGVKVADKFGAPAVQAKHTPGGYTPEFFFDGDPEFSEDCLYLNIWTPAAGKTGKKLPVTLWVHGGGYTAGWGHEPEMDGEEWAKHGGILVTFNYRLGIFGFFTHPLLSAESEHGVSGNYGMLDQIAALKWVKRNIAQFGGDPDNVTVMGQSAGAMSVQTLVTSPLSRDLVNKAIIQSGGGISDRPVLGGTTLEQIQENGKKLMDWAGYDTLDGMRAATTQDVFTLLNRYYEATGDRTLRISTAPVIDGWAYPETFSSAALGGRISDVPYMIGCTLNDMGALARGIDTFCLEREKQGGTSYAYQFARPLPTDGRGGVLVGAFHSSELWYMFKTLGYCWRPFTDADYALAEDMITCWTNFAKYGDPNGKGPEVWTPFTAENPEFMIFKIDDDAEAVASGMGRLN